MRRKVGLRVLRAWLLSAAVACAGSRAFASELALKDGGAGRTFGWNLAKVSERPWKKAGKEPLWRSGRPYYIEIRLGDAADNVIAAALDDSDPATPEYDTLYVDANNNGDLTDDSAIRPALNREGFSVQYGIAPLEVKAKYAQGQTQMLKLRVEMYAVYRRGRDPLWSVGYQVDQRREGRVDAGNRKGLLVAVYDGQDDKRGGNGCFNDYCADRLRMDLDGDGSLDPETEDFPLSRVVLMDGTLWDVQIDGPGGEMTWRPSTLPTGTVRLDLRLGGGGGPVGGMVEWADPAQGYALRCAMKAGESLVLPEGRYHLSRARFRMKDAGGEEWEAIFSVPQPFAVKRGEGAEVPLGPFGAPIRLEPTIKGRLWPGQDVCVMVAVLGIGGENYQSLSRPMSRMIPDLEIVDADGVEVLTARMEYG